MLLALFRWIVTGIVINFNYTVMSMCVLLIILMMQFITYDYTYLIKEIKDDFKDSITDLYEIARGNFTENVGIQILTNGYEPIKQTIGSDGRDCVLLLDRFNKDILKDAFKYCRDYEIREEGKQLVIKPNGKVILPLGFSLNLPVGLKAKILPKSGIGLKSDLIIPNSPGLIDNDYKGEVMVVLSNIGSMSVILNDRKAICQLVFEKMTNVEFYDTIVNVDTVRGTGGHGSTGSALETL